MKKKEYQELIDNMTFSFSRLNGFHHCKYCWARNYIEKDYEASQQNEFATVGIYIHELLEKYYKGELFEFQLSPMFQEWYKSEPRNYPNNKYVDLEKMYYNDFSEGLDNLTNMDDYEILEVEPKAEVNVKGYDFVGYVDLIVRNTKSGCIEIWDIKSWGKKKSKKEMKKYTRQLYLYSIYVKEKYGEYPSKLVFHLVRKSKLVAEIFTENRLEEAKNWVVNTIAEIRDCEEFPVTDDSFFGYNLCNFRDDDNHIIKDDNKNRKSYVLKLEDLEFDISSKK